MSVSVVALGGEPATGKSTVLQRALRHAGPCVPFEWGLVKGQLYEEDGLAVLGRYDPERERQGTDALAMNVIDDAENFIAEASANDSTPFDTVAFEGDRLWAARFFDTVRSLPHATLDAWLLVASPEALNHRHEQRGDEQSETWLRGRRTKYEAYRQVGDVAVLENETHADLERNVATIAGALGLTADE